MYLKGRYKSNLLKIALLCCILSGCNFLRTQYACEHSDGTKDLIEYKFEGRKLKLLDKRSYGNYKTVRIDTWFDDCQIFDEENWSCKAAAAVTAFEKIEMRDGVITWSLGDEAKTYKKTYTLKF